MRRLSWCGAVAVWTAAFGACAPFDFVADEPPLGSGSSSGSGGSSGTGSSSGAPPVEPGKMPEGCDVLSIDLSEVTNERGVFVDAAATLKDTEGNDIAPEGTKEKPFRAIGDALQALAADGGRTHIFVAAGTYQESLWLDEASTGGKVRRVFGGFTPSFDALAVASPEDPSAGVTSVRAPNLAVQEDGRGTAAVVIEATSQAVHLENLVLIGPPRASSEQSAVPGSYGVVVARAQNAVSLRCIQALGNTAAAGALGAPGAPGNAAIDGMCGTLDVGGGVGGVGDAGARGARGRPESAGGGTPGEGFKSRFASLYDCGNDGGAGAAGADAAVPGEVARELKVAQSPAFGLVSQTELVSIGGTGSAGQGGGGGAASYGKVSTERYPGGIGGAGGCGGGGAGPGHVGGSSAGLLVQGLGTGVAVLLERVKLAGGRGGEGARAMEGADGRTGADGTHGTEVTEKCGTGGRGGKGGKGGFGGPGMGGSSLCLLLLDGDVKVIGEGGLQCAGLGEPGLAGTPAAGGPSAEPGQRIAFATLKEGRLTSSQSLPNAVDHSGTQSAESN